MSGNYLDDLDPESARELEISLRQDIVAKAGMIPSSRDAGMLEEMMDHVHDIAGSAQMLGLDDIADAAYGVESLYLGKKPFDEALDELITLLKGVRP